MSRWCAVDKCSVSCPTAALPRSRSRSCTVVPAFVGLTRTTRLSAGSLAGTVLFLMPMALIIAWLSIPMVVNSFKIWEHSSDPGGLLRWPIKIVIPLGFVCLAVQGVAEIIKKYAVATGVREPGKHYERPVQ